MKKKIVTLLLAFTMVLSTGCISSEVEEEPTPTKEVQEKLDDFATIENPADIRETHSINGMWGTFSVKLDNAYVGDDVSKKLAEMGEEAGLANGLIEGEEGYKTVLLEYTLSADEGFSEEPFDGYEILGNDLWNVEHTSTFEYYSTELVKNANLDAVNLTLKTGESSKAYVLYALPENANAFMNCISGEDRDYWFIYNLD